MLSDNYAWWLRDEPTGVTVFVDPADAAVATSAIDAAGGRLDMILLTHHHGDHVAGVDDLRARYGCPVIGAKADAHRLPRLDRAVTEGDSVALGETTLQVIDTPGHTLGHIAFFGGDNPVLICGDTLFSLGCGRLLEGSAVDMLASLRKFADLPGDTLVCCGHEYTQSNARFAIHVDPTNAALRARALEVDRMRQAHQPTVPSRMTDELATNPFLRALDVATLASLRSQKDSFR